MQKPHRSQVAQFAWTASWLSVLFVLVYGYTNWRADVVTHKYEFYHVWELDMPFLPFMILPYFSLNLLTLTPLFYLSCPELRRLGRAMGSATIIAGFLFYVFPAPLGYLRPDVVPGWEPLFQFLHGVDRVNNTLPSLHVTYSFLTVFALWHRLEKRARVIYVAWLVLISCAVLFTWQHHVWDVITGVLLAFVCHRWLSPMPAEEGFRWDL